MSEEKDTKKPSSAETTEDKPKNSEVNPKTEKEKELEQDDKKQNNEKLEDKAEEPETNNKKKAKSSQKTDLISPADVKPGMVIKLWQKIKEKNPKGEIKERLQYFEGTVLARKGGNEAGATITIRKVSNGIAVEKIFPLALPTIEKIELLHKIKTRRAKLYFLRRDYKKRLKKVL
ncbi:50S ribosomal protein L19 [Candidatus Falkowbacteria bacterium]|jgi:large subunit ribosomal protein L19|nr:50S ribosomal protein L19 [Candidatus Falkowbacteria bacterium]MBT4432769.1 50S ribosomal protein L19 [Candidatus Falkowbacteria bacterium]